MNLRNRWNRGLRPGEDTWKMLGLKSADQKQNTSHRERIQMKAYEIEDKTELPIATSFKYIDTNIDEEGGCSKEVAKRIECAWDRRRELAGILCDRKIPTKLNVLLYKTAIRPALTYGNETWPLTQKLEKLEIGSTEMKCYGTSTIYTGKSTNDEIRQTAMIEPIADLMRRRRLQWYGHVLRRGNRH
jgi:hypothetical protein